MEVLRQAIEKITRFEKKFPKKAFQVIVEHKEEAIPILREALQKAILEKEDLDEEYQLHFYALFLLGEFQDKESFPKIMELLSVPEDALEYLIGDCITSDLPDILYNTYNGDLELLKDAVFNKRANEFARSSILQVMGQLYLDGRVEKEEWKGFLRKIVREGGSFDNVYNEAAVMICESHFVDMLPELRSLLENGLLDEMYLGDYASCVDEMFYYREEPICKAPFHAAERLRGWAMFEEDHKDAKKREADLDKLVKKIEKEQNQTVHKTKIGRNDPCPCGSGKKYKFCCMNKPKSPIDSIESPEERTKWLKDYPDTGTERKEGRSYLDEFFDKESIEIDKLLYLGLKERMGLIWLRNEQAENARTEAYLKLAFEKWKEKAEKEQTLTLKEYDEKFSIHYFCEEWTGKLLELLKENGEREEYKRIAAYIKEKNK